jgi:hypothetical protein
MALRIEPYREEHIAAVREFNARLRAGGSEFKFPESPAPEWLPPAEGRRIYQRFFLALEECAVRGAYILKFQDFSFGGEVRPVGYYHLPLSEGIVDPAHRMVGIQLPMDALRREPLLYALGMGGLDRPLPRMLKAMGWALSEVPFYFRVNHAARFLRQIAPLRKTAARRVLLNLAAWSGAGWAGVRAFQLLRAGRATWALAAEAVPGFGGWADELWEQCRAHYPFIAVRDGATLEALYPAGAPRFIRLKVTGGDGVLGWAVVLDTAMLGDSYFGDMRVGSIVDCLALPENAFAVVYAARRELERRGVDLIVSNQAHPRWSQALHDAGFLQGPSNFVFGASKALAAKLGPVTGGASALFLNRGDGDGPIHL